MEKNEREKCSLISVPQKSQLPVGVHLVMAVLFLVGAIVYTISPIDFIPDILGPIGWVDDMMVWVVAIMVDISIIRKRSSGNGKERQGRAEQKGSFI